MAVKHSIAVSVAIVLLYPIMHKELPTHNDAVLKQMLNIK